MLFKQDDVIHNTSLDEASQVVDSCQYLTEEESMIDPTMISIVENTRLGLDIIKVEDLVDYATSTGQYGFHEAVNDICLANNVDPNTIAFSVSDVAVLEDTELADTVYKIQESGYSVFATPISSNDIVYQVTEAVVDIMTESYGTCDENTADLLFEEFITYDLEHTLNESAVLDKVKSTTSDISKFIGNKYDSGKKLAAKKLASLKKTYEKLKKKASGLMGDAKKKCWVAMDKVNQGIEFLKNKIKK